MNMINHLKMDSKLRVGRLISVQIRITRNDISFLNSQYSINRNDYLRLVLKTKIKQLKVLKILFTSWRYYDYLEWLKTNHKYEPSIHKMMDFNYLLDYCLNNNYVASRNVYSGLYDDCANKKDHVVATFLYIHLKYKNKEK